MYGFAKVLLMIGDSHEVIGNSFRDTFPVYLGHPDILSGKHDGRLRERWGYTFSYFFALFTAYVTVIELHGTETMKEEVLARLIRYPTCCELRREYSHHHCSRDPSVAFTSGQWMTEVSLLQKSRGLLPDALKFSVPVDQMYPEPRPRLG